MEETTQNMDTGKITSTLLYLWILQVDLILFSFASPCCQVVCELLLEWLQNRGYCFSCSLFADFLCVSSKFKPLVCSWPQASPAALLTISISFGGVEANGLTVVGLTVSAFTCSFYSSFLKSKVTGMHRVLFHLMQYNFHTI